MPDAHICADEAAGLPLTLLEGLENLLVVKRLVQTLDGGQTLLAVALLHTDVHIILAGVVAVRCVGEGVCSSRKQSNVKDAIGDTKQRRRLQGSSCC